MHEYFPNSLLAVRGQVIYVMLWSGTLEIRVNNGFIVAVVDLKNLNAHREWLAYFNFQPVWR